MPEFSDSIDIRATPEEVFEFLVTPAGMTAWMGQHARLEPRVGGVFEVDIAGFPIRGQYLEVVHPSRVVVSWGVAGSDELPAGASRVTFTLTATSDGTRIDLVHSDLPDLLVAGHVDGWSHFLPRLAGAARGDTPPVDTWVPIPEPESG